jgi:signal transduction histidine kinase/ligand-binding sensor domain-containing protein
VLAAAAWLGLTSTAPLSAQERRPLVAPAAYQIDQWTTEDGLPQNSVNALVQGPDGYLWLGTFGGLVRFDGLRFTLMERTDSAGTRHVDRVLALAVGVDGSLWIGTENAGLMRRKDGDYEVYTTADGLPDDQITALHASGDGELWIETAHVGLTRFADGRFETLRDVDGEPFGPVASVTGDRDGRLWASDGGRLLVIEQGESSLVRLDDPTLSGAERDVLLEDRAGGVWVSRSEDMARWFEGDVSLHDVPDADVMVEDPDDGFWLGTSNDGLFHYRLDADGSGARRYPLADGQLDFRVRSAHVDRAENVWIGTNANGLLRARRNLFTTYTTEEGLSHDVATAIYGAPDGTMWIATNCGGVNAIDPERRTVRVHNPRASGDPEGDPCVFALTRTHDGAMWQGSYGKGVSRLTAGGGAWPRRIEGLPDSVVLALHTDRDGTMWVGTRRGGLAAVEDGVVRTVHTTADGLSDDGVRVVHETRDGDLWIGTLGGANRLADGRFTDTIADALHVRAFHDDADGDLWVGTYGAGLLLLRDGVATQITREDGLADNVVSAILEDDAGNLWMSGNRGIYRVARSELVGFAEGTRERVRSVLYGAADGLRTVETNGGFQPAAWKDDRGHLWFPTLRGVAVVDPGRAAVGQPAPSVSVEDVVVDGASRGAGDTVVVGPGRSNVEVRYAALSLSTPEHVAFRHRLHGFDRDWVRAGARRVAFYPRLEPGEYRFEVGAANRDGVWGESASPVTLRVMPPFWSTWWFRLAAAAGLVGVAAVVVVRRERATRREKIAREKFSRRLIESQEHERRRIAGALHDGLGQQLLVVRNRALMALRAADVDPEVRAQLHDIRDVASDSLADVRNLAHDLTPRQLEHLGLSASLEAMMESVSQAAGISLEATVDEIDGLLSPEGEINLYRVVQEALNNMARHSGAATGYVRIRRDSGAVRATVADDGRGFERDGSGDDGFGLSGMAERVRILGGSLDVETAPGDGTRIRVDVPVGGAGAGATSTPPETTSPDAPGDPAGEADR